MVRENGKQNGFFVLFVSRYTARTLGIMRVLSNVKTSASSDKRLHLRRCRPPQLPHLSRVIGGRETGGGGQGRQRPPGKNFHTIYFL